MSAVDTFVATLMQILRVLAGTADKQVEYLKGLGGASVDELGLEFEEVWLLAETILESRGITQYQYDAIKKLNDKLDQISGEDHEDLWSEKALFENKEWEQVRSLAKECLESFSGD
jgi:hypothetical protein